MSHIPPILFVHGMYMNAHSWKPWIARATQRGLVATAVSWPYHQGEPQERRDHIDPRLGRLTFGAIVASLKAHIDDMPERPILIGHSIGGLAVQKLLNDGYGRAGVAISPAPPLGVLSLAPEFFKANWPHLDPLARDRPIVMTKERFHYTFCNTMTRDESDAAYDLYVVPESRNVPRTTLTTTQARVDFSRDHVPLLLMAGDSDHLTPAAMIRRNAKRYELMVDVQEFAGRSHFICNQDGWEEVADAAFDFGSAV
ncbi:MAG: alpha/beta hydrolase [Pseudolysinimonas sp.]